MEFLDLKAADIIVEVNAEDRTDGSDPSFRRSPAHFQRDVWTLGWTDGRIGDTAPTTPATLAAQATLDVLREQATREGVDAAAQERVNAARHTVTRLQAFANALSDAYNTMATRHATHAHEFSVYLASIYLVIAVILLASDIPLSLRLVADGLGMAIDVPKDAGFWDRIAGSWEAVLLALGIAMLGIIVKLLTDEIMHEQRIPWRRALFLGSAVGLFLATTWVLGDFRANIQSQTRATNATQIETIRTLENRAVKDQGGERNTPPKEQVPDRSETLAFILLTVALPTIGGICFAMGWRNVERARAYRHLQEARKMAIVELAGAQTVLEQALDEARQAATRLAQAQDPTMRATLAESYQSTYAHGYQRGRRIPETHDGDASLYERCRRIVARRLALRVRAAAVQQYP